MLTAAVFSVLVSENARVLKGLDEIEFGANEDRQRVFGCARCSPSPHGIGHAWLCGTGLVCVRPQGGGGK